MEKGHTESIVEFVDIYPTLCELCDLPLPAQLDGKSMLPILKDLDAEIKKDVYIQWSGGYNIVTDRFNYAEWKKKDSIIARMLFDHKIDADENMNRVDCSQYSDVISSLSLQLDDKIKSSERQLKHINSN